MHFLSPYEQEQRKSNYQLTSGGQDIGIVIVYFNILQSAPYCKWPYCRGITNQKVPMHNEDEVHLGQKFLSHNGFYVAPQSVIQLFKERDYLNYFLDYEPRRKFQKINVELWTLREISVLILYLRSSSRMIRCNLRVSPCNSWCVTIKLETCRRHLLPGIVSTSIVVKFHKGKTTITTRVLRILQQ